MSRLSPRWVDTGKHLGPGGVTLTLLATRRRAAAAGEMDSSAPAAVMEAEKRKAQWYKRCRKRSHLSMAEIDDRHMGHQYCVY